MSLSSLKTLELFFLILLAKSGPLILLCRLGYALVSRVVRFHCMTEPFASMDPVQIQIVSRDLECILCFAGFWPLVPFIGWYWSK